MKKKIVVLLALVLVFITIFTTGCGKKEDTSTETTPAIAEEVLGESTETSYENTFFGFRFDAPNSSWYLLTLDELGQVMGIAASSLDDESLKDMFMESGAVTELYAMNLSEGYEGTTAFNNVNANIQDIGKLYGVMYSEKELAEDTRDLLVQTLEAQGATDVTTEITEAEFAGKNRTAMVITSNNNGIKTFQKQIYIKVESYVACITASSFGEDKTDEMLSIFKGI